MTCAECKRAGGDMGRHTYRRCTTFKRRADDAVILARNTLRARDCICPRFPDVIRWNDCPVHLSLARMVAAP